MERLSDYQYLFPFEKIPSKSRVVIYGGGDVGWEYLRQLMITKYADVVGVVDRRADHMERLPVRIFLPTELEKLEFDYIVLAFRSSTYHHSVLRELKKRGVDEKKIVYVPLRTEPKYNVLTETGDSAHEKTVYSYEMDCLSVAVKLGSAIGDNIFQKKFIEALAKLEPSLKIDIYSPASSSFLPWLYHDCPNVNLFVQDGGSLYMQQHSKYDLAFQVWVLVGIDHINDAKLKSRHAVFYKKIKAIEKKIRDSDMNNEMPMYTFYARAIKQGKNAYTVYGFDGELGVEDKTVKIALDDNFAGDFRKMDLPVRYITINYGNGTVLKDAKFAAKQWPLEYFERFAREFHETFPEIKVVQLGGQGACCLNHVDEHVIGRPLELAAYVLKNSMLHIDIEGGLVHLATQLGTKCVVLFGPTQEMFFGYEENINVKSGNCHDCYGMYLDYNKCARHMDQPECMYGITPEMVMEKVKTYFNGL